MEEKISAFEALLPRICDRETSYCPQYWSTENPLIGHCAVVALLAHDFFGGIILRASLSRTPFVHLNSHYWNRLNDGRRYDFTIGQFGGVEVQLEGDPRLRGIVLSDIETERRYRLLKARAREHGWVE